MTEADVASQSSNSISAFKSFQSYLRNFVFWILRSGPLPNHIAIIMDGNRRFADKRSVEREVGHRLGYERLIETMEMLHSLGIRVLSVYAFSIDNFKRSPVEVDTLMRLLKEKLEILCSTESIVQKHGAKVQILGKLSLFPTTVHESVEHIMNATRPNSGPTLNVCMPYTSREDIVQAIQLFLDENKGNDIAILQGELNSRLYTSNCPPVDLLVRTSGETRLSNFLLWQSSHAYLCFLPVYWPEFSFWNLVAAILTYQLNHRTLLKLRH